LLYWPAGQSTHLEELVSDILPAGQKLQVTVAPNTENWPAVQGAHAVAPTLLPSVELPGTQAVQLPVVAAGAKVLAGQGSHFPISVPFSSSRTTNSPAEHVEQKVWSWLGYKPSVQNVQSASPMFGCTLPAGHFLHFSGPMPDL
jgi:hypothetical protein